MATREAELFKDKIEVTLDGRQIFYLFFGGAVIACLVFVLGVTVGRRVEARANPPKLAAAVNDPLAALDELDAGGAGDLAFPAALRGQDDRPLGSVDVKAAKGQLRGPDATDEDAPKAAALEVAKPKAEPEPAAKPEPEAAAGAEAKPAPAPVKAVAPAVAAAKPAAEEPADKKDVRGTKFTLQLSSFQSKGEADAFLAQVKLPGQSPYIVQAEVEGKGTWYRVRVGDYKSYDEAIAAKSDFEAKQKIIAYVTRLK
jgi:cell division septation protein DedD